MIETILAFIIWTWGLTPLWVNIVITCLLAIRFTYTTAKFIGEFCGTNTRKDEQLKNGEDA